MIVKLTDKQYNAIDFWARRGYPVWEAIMDSLVPLEDDEYGVDEGDGNETAEALIEAYTDEMDAGQDPLQGVTEDVHAVARRIVDHMDYGLNYGFEDHDWDEDE